MSWEERSLFQNHLIGVEPETLLGCSDFLISSTETTPPVHSTFKEIKKLEDIPAFQISISDLLYNSSTSSSGKKLSFKIVQSVRLIFHFGIWEVHLIENQFCVSIKHKTPAFRSWVICWKVQCRSHHRRGSIILRSLFRPFSEITLESPQKEKYSG